jgi:hypothetical protein
LTESVAFEGQRSAKITRGEIMLAELKKLFHGVGEQFSVFSFQFSVFSFQFSVFSFQFSVFSFQFSVNIQTALFLPVPEGDELKTEN